MYKKGLAYKLLSFFSLLNLSLQPFFNFLLISTPAFVLAQEQIEAGITFDKGKNSFNLTVNKQGEIHYELFYRTDSQIENVSGISKNDGGNFSQEIYAGTCSSGGVCTPHQVLRGILKIEVKSEGWLSSKRFTVDNGNLNLVEESASSDLNLTDEENSWLENPDQQQIEKECLTNQSFVDTKDEDWNINIEKGIAETKEKVKLGVKYVFPLEDKVSVSFQCLPKEGATPLKIQKVKISDLNLPEGVNPYGEWAYDITTGMQDGSFEYDLTLPKPEGVGVEVSYMKDLDSEIKSVEEGDVSVSQEEDSDLVEVKDLYHMTVFVVVVDDGGNGYSDNGWSSHNSGYDGDHRWVTKDQTDKTATWRYTGDAITNGAIFVSWTQWDDHATNAKYTFSGLSSSGLSTTVTVNQKQNSGQVSTDGNGAWSGWYRVPGSFTNIPTGTTVTLGVQSGTTNGNLSADAVAFVDLNQKPTEVWVDDNYSLNNTGYHFWGYDAFSKIQEGVDAVAEGGTVNVAAGTYIENVVINKRLILTGAGSGDNPNTSTIIKPSNNNNPVLTIKASASGTSDSERLVLSNIRVDGTGNNSDGILIPGSVSYTTFSNVASVNNKNHGVNVSSFGGIGYDLKITDCVFSNNGGAGFRTGDTTIISGLTINNTQADSNKSAGLYFNGPLTGLNIDGGSFDDNYGDSSGSNGIGIYASYDNSPSPQKGGINQGFDASACKPNSIKNTSVSGNSRGIILNILGGSSYLFENITASNNNAISSDSGQGITIGSRDNITQEIKFSNITAENNSKSNLWFITYAPSSVSNLSIQNSTLTGSTSGYGLYLYAAAGSTLSNVSVTESTITGNNTGIYLRAGNQTSTLSNISIEKNSIGNNGTGILISNYISSGNSAHNNNIVGNKTAGIQNNDSNPVFDATLNWWGDITGPYNSTTNQSSTGNSVSLNVLYKEWLCEPYETDWTSVNGQCVGSCPMNGAIWTTESTCTDVNKNLYSSKDEVYLNGGPDSSGLEGLPDGNYYVRVTNPGGQDILGQSPYPNFTILKGSIVGCLKLWNLVNYTDDTGTKQEGYDTNPGGVYKVWVSPNKNFDNNCSKTDNFKVTSSVEPLCGDGFRDNNEQCDGTDGVATDGSQFCTSQCKLVPIYNGGYACPEGTVRSTKPIATYNISGTNPNGEIFDLTSGGKYLFEASGTFIPTSVSGYIADAGYTTINGDLSDQYGIHGTGNDYTAHALLADLGGGVGVVDWGDYNSEHIYTKYYEPTKSSVQFLISDRYDSWFDTSYNNQSGMTDNSGSLTLKVYECKPASEVTICKKDNKNRPQRGWEVVLASEKVDGPELIDVSNGSGTNSTNLLPAGKYLIKVSGTYRYGNSSMNADAGFSYRPIGIPSGCDCWLSGSDSTSKGLMARINGSPVNWGSYNEDHTYTYVYNHSSDGPVNISIWDDNYGDNVNNNNFQFEIYEIPEEYYGTTGDGGCVTLENIPYGNYILDEVLKDGWINLSGKGSSVSIDSSEENFTLVNQLNAPVTIVATKIVCDNEAYLPNWGTGGSDITATTAQNFLSTHSSNCHAESGWNFQWGDDWDVNPDDSYIGEVAGWNTFGPTNSDGVATVNINNYGSTSQIKVREVLKENYIPFTYLTNGNNSDNVSAEIYCDTDVLNYDNDDRFTPEYGKTYYCVGFNAPKYGSISGMKFEDVDGNKIKDVGDNGLENWTIQLKQGDVIVDSTTTDVNGLYSFSKVLTDDYQVCEVEQSGWTRTYPSGSNCQPVTVLAGEDTPNVNFGNFELGKISGYKIYDRNDNGDQDGGEKGIQGWGICLTGGSLETQNCITTDENGYYEFADLTAGTYTVIEEDRSANGWRASNPESGQSDPIIITSGENVQTDFYNAPPASILLTKSNNAAAPVKPGDPVEYTLTITVGERTLSEMTLIDILPNGFSYQTGTTNIATTLGGLTTTAHTEPTLKRANKKLVWTWPTGIAGGSIVVVKYTVKIDAANKPSSYNNLAHVWGSGSPTMVESQIVDSVVKIEPAYTPEGKVAGGEVLSAATQTTGQIEGQVLGATLPAAGANTWFLLAAIALIGTGLALRPKKKENRQKN